MKKMKKLLLLIAVIVTAFVCFALSASALDATGQCGDNVYWEYNSTTGELVISGEGPMRDYETHDSSPFYNSDIKKVIIGDSVTTIGDSAFYSCDNLTEVTIPDSVTRIGSYAFYECYNLTYITVDKNNQYFSNDEYGVLFNKGKTILIQYPIGNKRKAYTIPDSVTTICDNSFGYAVNLTSVTIPDSVTTICDNSFFYAVNLMSVTIPDSVKTIGAFAFYRTDYYSNASNWEDDVLYIEEYLIDTKDTLSGSYKIKDGTKVIANIAFNNCKSLMEVTIPDSVITIGDYAFDSCDNLDRVTIGDNVTTIGDSAFSSCDNLTEVTIPDSVITIGNCAFYSCDNLTEVTIPDSVTTIADKAFMWCCSLTEVTIPDSVTTIGGGAFSYCKRLTEVTIPDSVISICGGAFFYCHSLTNIYYSGTQEQWNKISIGEENSYLTVANIHYAGCYHLDENADKFCDVCKKYTEELYQSGPFGENVTYEWYADGIVFINGTGPMTDFPSYNSSPFYRAEVNSVVIGEGVTTVGKRAFFECKTLKRATIPDSVTLISDYAFANCDGLTSAPQGKNVTRIGEGAFFECDNIVELTIGDKVTSIGELAFVFCRKLPSVTIPENVISIEDGAFENCEKITNVTINGRLETIVDNTFYNCDSLECITLPDSITEIGERAFIYCTSLKDVYFGGTEDQWNEITILAYNEDLTNATIHFAAHSHTDADSDKFCDECKEYTEELYKSGSCGENVTYEWYEDGMVIISGTGSMTDYEYYSSPFYNSNIKSVVINDGVTTIGDYAFSYCNSLTEVTIPDSETTIGDNAFRSCYSLTEVTIPDSVTTIGDWAFCGCHNLTEVTIPDSVTTIGNYAFAHCYSLTEVTIPDSVTTIGDYAFAHCDSLAEVTIGNSVTTIGDYAFYSCGSLTEVTIGDSVTTIGDAAFYGCDSLTEVTIGDSVTTIGGEAFCSCDSLTEVTIGNSVTTIGDKAFCDCYSLTDVYYGGTQEQWKKIKIGSYNNALTGANIHYAGCYHLDENADKFCDNCGKYTEKLYKSGSCGNNVTYEWYEDGMVIISGTGAMTDYEEYNNSPFYGSNIKSVVINNSVTTIGAWAFSYCCSLTEVTIPDSVTTIGDSAFYYCYSLTEVTIPDSVTTIGEGAFAYCGSLTEVTIPDSVTTIGDSAFSWCNSLTDITVNENNQYFSNDEYGVLFNKDKTTLIQYPTGNKRTSYTIPDSVTTIGDYAFFHCGSLTEVTMGDSVTTIGDRAFCCCSSLTEVTIPDSVTTIGDSAFYFCDSLTDVYYGGTQEQWKKISIGSCNYALTGANIHYNYCPHTDTDKTSYPQQNPTCTEIGYTAGVYCNICQRWSDGHEKIKAKGHSYTEKIIDSAHLKSKATVEKSAVYKYDCANCDSISPDKTFTHGNTLALGVTSSVTATQTTSSLTLTWDKAPNATGYRLYYKLPGDMSWRTSVSYITATTKTFSGLPSGQAYRFAIRSAYKKADGTYILGGYKQIATATKAVAPANVDSLQNASSIRLNWTACPGATGYRIYYKSGNAWKICVSTTAATAHTFSGLKSGAKYTFAVRPYILVEGVVIWSNYITITTATQTISPVVTATSTSSGRIDLSWKAVNGAEAYQVYYKVGNGNYKLYKTYTSVQSLKFANLKAGTKYTFAVRGVIKGSEENIYGFHNPVTVTVR